MATTNPTITGNWSLIVQEGDEFLLTLPLASQSVHVAIGAADDSDSDSDPEAPPTARRYARDPARGGDFRECGSRSRGWVR